MSLKSSVLDGIGASYSLGTLSRFIPEPSSKFKNVVSGILNGVSSVAQTVAPTSTVGIDPTYQALIQQQMQAQEQMQRVSMVSNIEKSKHETQMSAVRNIRVG